MDAGELLLSTDAGVTWKASQDPLVTAMLPGSPSSRLLAYAPTGNTLVLTAANATPGATSKHVLVSHDDGASFSDVTEDIHTLQFNHLAWDGRDLYLASSGEGVLRYAGLDP